MSENIIRYKSNELIEAGQPTILFLAEVCHLSLRYLSDLLSKETDRSAKVHNNDILVDKAEILLLAKNDTISGVVYNFGYNYLHYFSRIFKSKTGLTPQEYREHKLKSN